MGQPAIKGNSRIFYIEGGARPDREPIYKSCWRLGPMAFPAGDVSDIECPDPDRYEAYVTVGEIQAGNENLTNAITGRYELDKESDLLRMRRKRCALDVQNHLGRCTDPQNFNDCKKAFIIESTRLTDWTTTDMGGLASDEEAVVDETSPLSSADGYEALPIRFTERAQDVVTNPVVDIVICDFPSCGDCEDESDGCEDIYAVDDGATGSPGTAPDLIWSLDKGIVGSWNAENIGSLGMGSAASGLACIDIYVVVISNADNSYHYKERLLMGDGVTAWIEYPTAFVVGGEPNDIWSPDGHMAFVVGDGGYVYQIEDPVAGYSTLDAAIATQDNLNAVHAISDKFAVAVGDNSAVIYTINGSVFQAAEAEPGDGTSDLQCVWIVDENLWWAGGTIDGNGDVLWYTLDGGTTWTAKTLPPSTSPWAGVYDIAFASKSVGRLVVNRSLAPPVVARGFVMETWDAGYSWTALPRGFGSGVFPDNDNLVALAVCEHDVNFAVVGGDDGAAPLSDGMLFVGED